MFGCSPSTARAQAAQKRAAAAAASGDFALTKYDLEVASPQIAVGRDGTIHVVFVEATKRGLEDFVFYRSSTDGGKSWTAARNLSEDMAGLMVGPAHIAVDGQGRVYAVWRVAAGPNTLIPPNSRQAHVGCNLVYRVLSGGQWSAILPINEPQADPQHQRVGIDAFFAGADSAGKMHVAYSVSTDVFHPELMFHAGTSFAQHSPGMGNGSIAQVDLDGAEHSRPREAFLTPVVVAPSGNKCDALTLIDGYFDQSGAPHIVAQADAGVGEPFGQSRIVICENGKQSPVVTLPSADNAQFRDPPCLFVDAQGNEHVIVDFKGGEQHTIRDYVVGTGQYTVVKAEKPNNNPLRGFQVGQGAGGTGAVVMELSDSGLPGEADNWLAVYDGKAWRPAVQLTNYKDKSSASYKAFGSISSVTSVSSASAGPNGATTVDPQGHVLLVYESDLYANFAVQGAVSGVGGGTSRPVLMFHRF